MYLRIFALSVWLASSSVFAADDQTDRMIVKYKGGQTPSVSSRTRTGEVLKRHGLGGSVLRLNSHRATVFQLSSWRNVSELRAAAAELMTDPAIEYAEPDVLFHPSFTFTNDPNLFTQYHHGWWYLDDYDAWDFSTGANVNIAIVDTGVRPHADLAARFLPGYDFINALSVARDGNGRDNDASDPGDTFLGNNSSWHGTHVAGIAAASGNNALGGLGVAFGARILPVRVLGSGGGYLSDIADGIRWASGLPVPGVPANPNPARVINLSLGASGPCSFTMDYATNDAEFNGSVLVVAAGNSNQDVSNTQPANCSTSFAKIVVGSVNPSYLKSSYSNFGSLVSISAFGDNIFSTFNAGQFDPGGDSYAYLSGTSMATPMVSGIAALVAAKYQISPSVIPDAYMRKFNEARMIKDKVLQAVTPFGAGCCTGMGTGIANAKLAVDGSQPFIGTQYQYQLFAMPGGYAAMQIVPTLVTGGVAPYTYQWTINDSRVSITGANSPSPTLQTWISYCGFLATTGAVTMTDSRGVISTSRFNFVAMDAFCGGGGGA